MALTAPAGTSPKAAALQALHAVQEELRALEAQLGAQASPADRQRLAAAQAHVQRGAARLRSTVSPAIPGGDFDERPLATERIHAVPPMPLPRLLPGGMSPGQALKHQRQQQLMLRAPELPQGRTLLQAKYMLPSSSTTSSPRSVRLYGSRLPAPWKLAATSRAALAAAAAAATIPALPAPLPLPSGFNTAGPSSIAAYSSRNSLLPPVHRPTFITEEDGTFFDPLATVNTMPTLGEEGEGSESEGGRSSSTSMNSGLDDNQAPRLLLRRGELDSTHAYQLAAWRTRHAVVWPDIERVLAAGAALCKLYSLTELELDAQRVLQLATSRPRYLHPYRIMACLVQEKRVAAVMRRPGQRFRGTNAADVAARFLQRCWLQTLDRRRLQRHQCEVRAAVIISNAWLQYTKRRHFRKVVLERRAADVVRAQELQTAFRSKYQALAYRQHVVVHLPSLSLGVETRGSWRNLHVTQLRQLGRVFQACQTNVALALVWPEAFDEALYQYYVQWIARAANISVDDAAGRFTVIELEHAEFFAPWHLSLTQALLYCPRALRMVSNQIRGVDAYILPSVVGTAEHELSSRLNLPIFGTLFPLAQDLLSQSKVYRLLELLNVPLVAQDVVAPGDLESEEERLWLPLAKLIVRFPQHPWWEIVLNCDPANERRCGFAADNRHLKSLTFVEEQRTLQGAAWIDGSRVQVPALRKVAKELPEVWATRCVLTAPSRLTWLQFRETLHNHGGIIRPAQPSHFEKRNSVESPAFCVTALLEPRGDATTSRVVLACDSISSTGLRSSVQLWPSHLPEDEQQRALRHVGTVLDHLASRGALGYVGLVLERRPSAQQPQLPPSSYEFVLSSLDLGLTDTTAGGFLTRILEERLKEAQAAFRCRPIEDALVEKNESGELVLRQSKAAAETKPPRPLHLIWSWSLMHSNLIALNAPVLLKVARARGITMQPEYEHGAMLLPLRGHSTDVFGLLSVADSWRGAAEFFDHALTTIVSEVATPGLTTQDTCRGLMQRVARYLGTLVE